jgi:hypothetical protein
VVDLRVSYLTHRCRAVLAETGVYPASRPESPEQLRQIGHSELADELQDALASRAEHHTSGHGRTRNWCICAGYPLG